MDHGRSLSYQPHRRNDKWQQGQEDLLNCLGTSIYRPQCTQVYGDDISNNLIRKFDPVNKCFIIINYHLLVAYRFFGS